VLAELVKQEPVHERDRIMMGMPDLSADRRGETALKPSNGNERAHAD
jgi:hypothetical protein